MIKVFKMVGKIILAGVLFAACYNFLLFINKDEIIIVNMVGQSILYGILYTLLTELLHYLNKKGNR